MTIKRFPNKSDFVFLSPLWDLVKNPRNGLLCGDNIPSLMTTAGFDPVENCWTHPSFYGTWSVMFSPEDEKLWIMECARESWEDPRVLVIEDPTEMEALQIA